MAEQHAVCPVRAGEVPRVVEVWEASVRATHDFLSEDDIEFFRPLVRAGLDSDGELVGVRDESGVVVAFASTVDRKLEALFVHPDWRGTGIGRVLLSHAVEVFRATSVDVNEQNEQAVGFYLRMGCEVRGRSELDGSGRPFPLLHMRLPDG